MRMIFASAHVFVPSFVFLYRALSPAFAFPLSIPRALYSSSFSRPLAPPTSLSCSKSIYLIQSVIFILVVEYIRVIDNYI